MRNIATRLLTHLGFNVTVAMDGREAVEMFPNLGDVRFVFLDLTMPHMDGPETFRELRRMKPETRVLIMSGFSEEDVADRFGNDRFVAFVEKPFNLPQVREKIRNLLR